MSVNSIKIASETQTAIATLYLKTLSLVSVVLERVYIESVKKYTINRYTIIFWLRIIKLNK